VAVSQADAKALEQLVPGLGVTVIPNGIDTDEYQVNHPTDTRNAEPGHPPTVVFTGKMDFRPNVDAVSWFVEEIWGRVQAEVPEARFYAVGQRPAPQLDRFRSELGVTLTGWVEDVLPYIANATVYVAPLRMGSGTRLKLLQAMALGKAIVSTRIGAEGLAYTGSKPPTQKANGTEPTRGQVVSDREMVLVDDNDPAAFANAVVALLHNPARRAALGSAARVFVEAYYDWRVIIPRLEALYAE
jgi:glycosyltransferase involved in cell wall biosynthesis